MKIRKIHKTFIILMKNIIIIIKIKKKKFYFLQSKINLRFSLKIKII